MKRCKIIRSLTKTYRRRALMAAERKHWMRNRRPAFVRRLEFNQRLARARLRMIGRIKYRINARIAEICGL